MASLKLPARVRLDSGLAVDPVLPESGVARDRYLPALDALSRMRPRLWLPAVPVCDQNANLYDSDWAVNLAANRAIRGSDERAPR